MNEIEFPADRIDYRERDAANADDASTIRARVTPPANEPDAGAVPGTLETPVDEATEERLKMIRAADREKVEKLLKRDLSTNSATNPSTSTATDEAVKPAAGTGKPLGKKGEQPENTIRPKPVFEKTGYDVPKSVTNQYVAHEGKFLDRKSETVHFEDKGRSLSTASEDRDVIAHMVEVAKAKNWGELQLKGSEEFRRQAWIAAELAGVPTRGFKPGAQDRAVLTAAREAMRIGAGDKSSEADRARTNEMEAADAVGQKPAMPQSAKLATPGRENTVPGGNPTTATQPSPVAPASPIQGTPTPAGVTAGVLMAHGPAPFNHDEKQNDSYYATVRTEDGERTVWGLDIERAIGESGVQAGQRIELEKGGSKSVTALQRQFDEKGTELAPKSVESRRNEWLVFSPDVPGLPTREQREALASARRDADERRQINEARERFLSGDWKYSKEQQKTLDEARERIKAQAAREVLRDEIKGLPEQQQEKLMGEFESAVAEARAANRPLDVPMPQVSEATIEAVRGQIERERAGQGRNGQQPSREQAQPAAQTQEAGHDAPTLEIES
ncbi:LPD7 domain-containing protein [Paraburkholderia caledonica]